jgi:hypothetical protein
LGNLISVPTLKLSFQRPLGLSFFALFVYTFILSSTTSSILSTRYFRLISYIILSTLGFSRALEFLFLWNRIYLVKGLKVLISADSAVLIMSPYVFIPLQYFVAGLTTVLLNFKSYISIKILYLNATTVSLT